MKSIIKGDRILIVNGEALDETYEITGSEGATGTAVDTVRNARGQVAWVKILLDDDDIEPELREQWYDTDHVIGRRGPL